MFRTNFLNSIDTQLRVIIIGFIRISLYSTYVNKRHWVSVCRTSNSFLLICIHVVKLDINLSFEIIKCLLSYRFWYLENVVTTIFFLNFWMHVIRFGKMRGLWDAVIIAKYDKFSDLVHIFYSITDTP